jgi:hypothetical protein
MQQTEMSGHNLKRPPFLGVYNIVRFNYEFFIFAGTVIAFSMTVGVLLAPGVPSSLGYLVAVGVVCATLASLAVSCWVYDLSPLYTFTWLDPVVTGMRGNALNIHAGFDETTLLLRSRYPHLSLEVMDFYNPVTHTERSIRRARAVQPPVAGTKHVLATALGLRPSHYRAVFLFLAIHEIRDATERDVFLRQLRESLTADGMLIVVEHARDSVNFLAYNIGFLHFLPARELLNGFENAGFRIVHELRITPFLRVFQLGHR